MTASPRFCVCVPARNEADYLPRLLTALANQDLAGAIPVAICINNSTDSSAADVAAVQGRWADRLDIRVEDVIFPQERAHAGTARRTAMDAGVRRLGQAAGGVLISTDADARPPRSWLAANLDAIAAGADMVGGRLVLDEDEGAPSSVLELRAFWDAYWEAVRKVEDLCDPDPGDPAPRHGDHTGASLAITVSAYARADGVPVIPSGEDRALVIAAQAQGARLRHPLSVWTRVSARTIGRAAGGMAEDMMRLHAQAQADGPILAPDLTHWEQRALWRRDLRRQPGGERRIAELEGRLPPMPNDMDLRRWARGDERRADVGSATA
jgi:hypothetical protein